MPARVRFILWWRVTASGELGGARALENKPNPGVSRHRFKRFGTIPSTYSWIKPVRVCSKTLLPQYSVGIVNGVNHLHSTLYQHVTHSNTHHFYCCCRNTGVRSRLYASRIDVTQLVPRRLGTGGGFEVNKEIEKHGNDSNRSKLGAESNQ